MSAFRTGNKAKSHPYPSTGSGSGGPNVAAFARNFASGPANDTAVLIAGTQISWSSIDGGSPLGPDVPITPHVTGKYLVTGVITFENSSVTPVNVQVEIQLNGVSILIPSDLRATLDAAPAESVSTIAIPFMAYIVGQPLGVTKNIQIFVSASDDVTTVNVVATSSSINIQEVTNSQ